MHLLNDLNERAAKFAKVIGVDVGCVKIFSKNNQLFFEADKEFKDGKIEVYKTDCINMSPTMQNIEVKSY